MARFSQMMLRGMLDPSRSQRYSQLGQSIGQAPGIIGLQRDREEEAERLKNMSPVERANYMLSRATTPEQITAAESAKTSALQQSGQESLAVLQGRMEDAQRRMSEFSQMGETSRVEAAKAEMQSLEDAMVSVSQQTRQTDMSKFIGEADRREAEIKQQEFQGLQQEALAIANREKLAVASLERFAYGSPEWNDEAERLKKAGQQGAVAQATKRHNERETARLKLEEEMLKKGPLSPAEQKELTDRGITIPSDSRAARNVYRTFQKKQIESEIETALRPYEPLEKFQAEAVVSYTLRELSKKYDYVDIFTDDIEAVIKDLSDEQRTEIVGLVTGRSEAEAVVVVEQWLRQNYPDAFERSEKEVQRRESIQARREEALQEVFNANPNLDPNDPVDRRLAEESLDSAVGDSVNVMGTPMLPATAY